MAKFIGRKVGGVPLETMLLAGVVKPFAEQALIPVVGDGNFVSGAVKTIGGAAVSQFAGRGIAQDSVAIALVVDGVEDLMRGLFGMGGSNADPFGGAL